MYEFLPIIIVGAIIGAFSILFIMAYVALNKSKEERAKSKVFYGKNLPLSSYLFCYIPLPWQFLYFLPDPQGQGSLRPTFFSTWIGIGFDFSA